VISILNILTEQTSKIKFTKPNFEFEWNEANRYPEFKEMGKQKWTQLAKQGKIISYSKIKDILGNVDLRFNKLDKNKRERFNQSFYKGQVEFPIAVKFSETDYDLVAGNTRLAGLVEKGIDPQIWIVEV
jgi:hypothetical protein